MAHPPARPLAHPSARQRLPVRAFETALCVATLLVLAACGERLPDGPDDPSPVTWSLSPEPRTAIGALDGDPDYLFQRIADAAFLPDGRIVVADGGLGEIRVYRADGTFEGRMGRTGEGPGEFRWLNGIAIAAPDTIFAWDGRNQALAVYLADGTLVGSTRIHADTGSPERFLGRFSDGNLGLAWIVPGPRSSGAVEPDVMGMGRFGADGTMVRELGRGTGMRRFGVAGVGSGPVPFSPFFQGRIHGDLLYHTDGARPEIAVSDGEGRRVRTLATPDAGHDPARVWADLEAELEAQQDAGALERLAALPRTDSLPHVAALLIDHEGHIWAKRYDPEVDALWRGGMPSGRRGTGGAWWVLDGEGGLVTTVAMPEGVRPLDVRGGRLLGLHRDDLDVERVVVYDLGR